jgi:hypothetical protein
MKKNSKPNRIVLIAALIVTLLVGPACEFSLLELPTPTGSTPPPPTLVVSTTTPLPVAQVTFHASLPSALPVNESLALRVLDEVTGLGFNYVDYPMQAHDPLNYTATLPVPANSVMKYKYIRVGGPGTPEYNAFNQPLRYRLFYSVGPSELTDVIAAWPDRPFIGAIGSIQGTAVNADNGAPIPSLLVTAGGIQSITDSAGRFNLQGLPVGTHNVVAYAMDGMYQTFQQGATVAQGLTTPVSVSAKPAALVPVTFTVHVPNNTQIGAPLRLAGNLIQLGNTFSDMKGGMSVIPERMPILARSAEGTYTYTVNLPVGADIRYKYTLGDGLWNAEHKSNGEFNVRQIIVPPTATAIEEVVSSWQAGPSAPISFEVTIPANTPAGDVIYIQFNPYGWTEPIPMWFSHDNVWKFKLYGPLNLDTLYYRYCRNGQCGVADDSATAGLSATGRQVNTALMAQDLRDTVTSWAWIGGAPSNLAGTNVIARTGAFMTGVEFQSYYEPDWLSFTGLAMQNVQALGSNWVILTPSWTYSASNPLVFGTVPGPDPLWIDSELMVGQARSLKMNTALFPQPRFPTPVADWWRLAPRDANWWNTWFDYYRAFAVHYADMAAHSGSQALILAGDWVGPALPNGTLFDGTPSGVPADADVRWKAIIAEVRKHFRGQVLWAMPYSAPNLQTPPFLSDTDGIYLLISGTLVEKAVPTHDELAQAAAALLDNGVGPLQSLVAKPVYLAFAYPSASGATMNCIPNNSASCLTWKGLDQPNLDLPEVALNLQLQADIYEALFAAVNTRPWVSGIVVRGYYPPTLLQDKSASIHGKPAGDVLWYWYQRLLGIVK